MTETARMYGGSRYDLAAEEGLDERIPVSYTHLDVYKRQMQDTVVEPGAELDCVVTDKNVRITADKKLSGTKSFPVYVQKNHIV